MTENVEAPAFTATLHIMILLHIGYTWASVLGPVAMTGAVGEDVQQTSQSQLPIVNVSILLSLRLRLIVTRNS